MNGQMIKYGVYLLLSVFSTLSHAGDLASQAEAARAEKNYRMAVVYYQRALRETPDDMMLRLELAKSYELWGQDNKAHRIAFEVVSVDPGQTEALLLLARIAARAGDLTNAEAHLRQVIEKDPWHIEAKTALVGILNAQGKRIEANRLAREGEQSVEHGTSAQDLQR